MQGAVSNNGMGVSLELTPIPLLGTAARINPSGRTRGYSAVCVSRYSLTAAVTACTGSGCSLLR